MRISVVIPVWNRRTLIPRAIHSVLNQTVAPFEVIVVDDGSSDGTGERVAADFPTVRLLTQSNRGVSAARNLGIRAARGDWIGLLDSDDEWLPEKLALQTALIDENPGCRVCHTDEIWIRNGRRVNPMQKHSKPDGEIFTRCLPLCCVSPSAVLIDRTLFDEVGLFDESLPACEDYDLWLRLFSRYPIKLAPQALVRKYGGHEDQLSRKHWGMDRFRVRALAGILEAGTLNQEQAALARQTLREKCGILANGCDKRGKTAEADGWRETAGQWP